MGGYRARSTAPARGRFPHRGPRAAQAFLGRSRSRGRGINLAGDHPIGWVPEPALSKAPEPSSVSGLDRQEIARRSLCYVLRCLDTGTPAREFNSGPVLLLG